MRQKYGDKIPFPLAATKVLDFPDIAKTRFSSLDDITLSFVLRKRDFQGTQLEIFVWTCSHSPL